jgi:TonB family protein
MRGFKVRALRNLMLVALFVGLGVGSAAGQEAGSAVTAPTRVNDVGPDLIAPELLRMERTIPEADACKTESEDLITLSLIVDANGRPRDVTVINPKGTPVERLATRVMEEDSFKPGTLKGEPVEVRLVAHVSIEGCVATKRAADGSSSEVFRLRAQPLQTFGAKPTAETTEQKADEIAAARAFEAAAAETPGLERIGKNGVSAPVLLYSVQAEFPDEARRAHASGVCRITMIVDTQGKPQNPRIVRAAGYGLDRNALEAVRKYRFRPAMKAGVPVPVMITVEENFNQ